jgi:hypothetical protein
LLARFVHDPNLALVLLSIAANCGTVVFIYLLALKWFGQLAARFAALLFLLSPLAWFHGIVALTYGIEAFFSALTGYLCWLVFRGDHRWAPAIGLVLGVSAGVRPSSRLLLGPLFLLVVFWRSRSQHGLFLCCVQARDFYPKWAGFRPMNDLELKAPEPRLYEDSRVPWDLLIGLSISNGREELPYSISGAFHRSRTGCHLRRYWFVLDATTSRG